MSVTSNRARFFNVLDDMVRTHDVVVDRPKGRPHPNIAEVLEIGCLLVPRN
ncbi:MAG: hypothetical protein IIC71_11150 [Acidobacteria bacterium]|nr:hypothetical protein [Acidobacteriota bacterium]